MGAEEQGKSGEGMSRREPVRRVEKIWIHGLGMTQILATRNE